MTLELEQEITSGGEPSDQQEEQERQLTSEDLKTHPENLTVGLGYEGDDQRRDDSPSDQDF